MSNKDLEKMNLAQLKAEYDEIFAGNDNDRKIAVLTKIIKLNPEDAKGFYNRGNAYSDLGKHDKAIEDYNQAIKLNPKNAEFFNNRGDTYNYLDEHDKAIEDFNQAIELNPEIAEALYNLGIAHRKLGKEDLAIKNFEEAVALNPTIIAQEHIKKLGKELSSEIKQTQASNAEVREFHETLEELQEKYEKEENKWLKQSKNAVITTAIFIVLMLALLVFTDLESSDIYMFYVFLSIIAFTIVRQYTNAKVLRIEATNRLAMAKMFEKVKQEDDQEYKQEFLPKLVDAIVYSTVKEKNNTDGLVEKIIDKFRKI